MNAKNVLAFADQRRAYETILEDFRGEENKSQIEIDKEGRVSILTLDRNGSFRNVNSELDNKSYTQK